MRRFTAILIFESIMIHNFLTQKKCSFFINKCSITFVLKFRQNNVSIFNYNCK